MVCFSLFHQCLVLMVWITLYLWLSYSELVLGNFSRFIIAIVRIYFLGFGDQLYLVSYVFHVHFILVFLCDDICQE